MTKLQDKQVRIERDFLGEKEVDTQAYYGIQTLRAVENFPITGYRIHEELIKALGIVKKANSHLQIWILSDYILVLEKKLFKPQMRSSKENGTINLLSIQFKAGLALQ